MLPRCSPWWGPLVPRFDKVVGVVEVVRVVEAVGMVKFG